MRLIRRLLRLKSGLFVLVATLAIALVVALLSVTATFGFKARRAAADAREQLAEVLQNFGANGVFDASLLPEQASSSRPWISRVGSRCKDVTPEIVAGIIQVESNWNPRANQGKRGVGLGLAQFLPSTWAAFGLDGDGDGDADIFSEADAVSSAENYLCHLAATVRMHIQNEVIPNVKPPASDKAVRDLMIVAYNKGPNIWLLETWDGVVIKFDANGIPDATHSDGMTGQKYLARVNEAIHGFIRSTGSGTLGGMALMEAMKVVRGEPIRGTWPGGAVPYSWGGGNTKGPTHGSRTGVVGFDCSGLMIYIFFVASNGRLNLPHLADAQKNYGSLVTQGVGRVNEGVMLPGDVIFYTDAGSNVAHHVAIYKGDTSVVNAYKTGTNVRVDPFSSFDSSDTWTVKRFSVS